MSGNGQHLKTVMSNGKPFTVMLKCWPLLHVIKGGLMLSLESQRVFSKFAFVLFCYITYNNSLNVWSLGEQWILFPKGVSQGTSHSVFATVLTTSCHQIGKLKNISYMIKNLILINYFVTSLSLDVLKSVFLNFFTSLWKTFPDAMLIRAVHQGTYI